MLGRSASRHACLVSMLDDYSSLMLTLLLRHNIFAMPVYYVFAIISSLLLFSSVYMLLLLLLCSYYAITFHYFLIDASYAMLDTPYATLFLFDCCAWRFHYFAVILFRRHD